MHSILFGTRPEFIKMLPIIWTFKKAQLPCEVIFTGQHHDMVLPMMQYFGISPDVSLQIMQAGQSLADIAEKILRGLRDHWKNQGRPKALLVQGDTSSAAIAALLAFYEKIPVYHVEAGLRTYNLRSPWPEEFNRRLIALCADLHFAPTTEAAQCLLQEGFPKDRVFVTGNTSIDTLLAVAKRNPRDRASEGMLTPPPEEHPMGLPLSSQNRVQVLVTLHRRENFGSAMDQILSALKVFSQSYPQVDITWPMHKNPEVRKSFDRVFPEGPAGNWHIVEPLDYVPFVQAMQEADIIVTDSGGVQEEAPALGKPVLVCRDTTERPEAVSCGNAKLVGTQPDKILASLTELMDNPSVYQHMAQARFPYGDGHAATKMVEIIREFEARSDQTQAL